MKKVYFTVGPSQLYSTYQAHMKEALAQDIGSKLHRGAWFAGVFDEATGNFRKLLGIPKEVSIFFVGSSLESMERIIQGVVYKESFHLLTGAFGKKWHQTALDLGKKATKADTPDGMGYDFSELTIPKTAELVAITQNDTSTGVAIPIPEIYYLKSRFPDKLFALDIVSSSPYVDVDFTKVEMGFLSVQKGFGLPAGLGILIVSPSALEKAQWIKDKGGVIGSYHSFLSLKTAADEHTTPETPNVLAIWLLNEILKDMLKVGIEKIRKDTDTKAQLIFDFFEKHSKYEPFVKFLPIRSKTSIVIDVKGDSKKLREKAGKQGIEIGSGYGSNKENHLRIANFPQHSIGDVKKLLSTLV